MTKTCGHKHITVPDCDTCRIAELEETEKLLTKALEMQNTQVAKLQAELDRLRAAVREFVEANKAYEKRKPFPPEKWLRVYRREREALKALSTLLTEYET